MMGEVFSSVAALGGATTEENGNEIELPVSYQPVYEEKQLAGQLSALTTCWVPAPFPECWAC